jgi:hypothetical protein
VGHSPNKHLLKGLPLPWVFTLGIMEKMKNRNNAFQKSKMLALMRVLFLNAPLSAEENLCLISCPLDTL